MEIKKLREISSIDKNVSDTVLVIAPHLDDEILGCGGAIQKHISNHDNVFVLFVADRKKDHKIDFNLLKQERQQANEIKDVLGYNDCIFCGLVDEELSDNSGKVFKSLEIAVSMIRPSIVYSCWGGDINQDHHAVFRALSAVMRSYAVPFLRRVLCYETSSSTEQSPPSFLLPFTPNHFVEITKTQLDTKLSSLSMYTNECREKPHPRSNVALKSLAIHRGSMINKEYAEAFVMIRNIE
jgi:N-acetylglucosamine malate deacetylase 1